MASIAAYEYLDKFLKKCGGGITMAEQFSEVWEVKPFQSLGSIHKPDTLESLTEMYGSPSTVRNDYLSGAVSARWGTRFSADFLPDGRLLSIGSIGMHQLFCLRNIVLRGTVTNLEKKLLREGITWGGLDGPYSESYELPEVGVSLFVPMRTKTVKSVSMLFSNEEIPPETFERPRATKEGNLLLLARLTAERLEREAAGVEGRSLT
jgi:hypothetical protein